MYLTWFGQSCFKLQDKLGPDGVTVVTDPFDPKFTGLSLGKLDADIVTISHQHQDHNYLAAIKGKPLIITTAGEFERRGIFIEGVDAAHDAKNGSERGQVVIYRIDLDGLSVTHLSDLGIGSLDNKQLEKLAGTDILLIPVGGKYTIDADQAVAVVNQLEPRIVVPMHYALPNLKFPLEPVDKFIKALGLTPKTMDKIKISKKELPAEATELYILQPNQ